MISGIGRIATAERMSVDQLKQSLQNKTLPAYIAIPLIEEKMNMEERMRNMQAMQQPSQQPPIAEQVLSRAQGIDTLPTNLAQAPTQDMAGGGIVAFADGGDVERYQNQGLVGGSDIESERDALRIRRQIAYQANNMMEVGRIDKALSALPPEKTEYKTLSPNEIAQNIVSKRSQSVDPDTIRQLTTPPAMPGGYSGEAAMGAGIGNALLQQAAPAPEQKAPPKDDTGGIASLGSGIKVPGVSMPKFKGYEGDSYEDMAKKYYEQYRKDFEAREKSRGDDIDALRKSVPGEPLAEYKKSLEQEALQAGADKEQAKYMSLFKAGLAMMSGTSRHALQNIGAGAMVGAEDYQRAYKDIKKAEKERQKSFAFIEQAQRAEKIGDRDTAIRSLEKAYERRDAAQRYVGEGIFKASTMDRREAFDMAKVMFEQEAAIGRTDLAGQYHLAGQKIAAASKAPKDYTTALATSIDKAQEIVGTYDMFRGRFAKSRGLVKVPPPGADAKFDADSRTAWNSAVRAEVQRRLPLMQIPENLFARSAPSGTSGGNSSGFSIESVR